MIKKLTLLVGVGAGYVLGAKAGTQRYEQIMGKVNELMGKPAVQNATDSLASSAGQFADKAKSTVNDKVESVTGSSTSTPPPVSTITPPPTTPAPPRTTPPPRTTAPPAPITPEGPIAGAGPSVTALDDPTL